MQQPEATGLSAILRERGPDAKSPVLPQIDQGVGSHFWAICPWGDNPFEMPPFVGIDPA